MLTARELNENLHIASRCLDIRAGIQLFDERNLIKLSVVKANVFSSWKYQTDRAVPLREKALAAIVQRQSSRLMIQAFASWRHETKTQSRNGIIVIHAIDRLSFRTMKEALFAWRIAAVERKRRRDMMVCLMEQSFKRSRPTGSRREYRPTRHGHSAGHRGREGGR